MRQVKGFNVNPEVPSWPEFWDRVEDGSWEPETFKAMDRYLAPDWRWVDIGAWIGPTVLYAAKKCDRVDAFECDPVALEALRANLALNPDIQDVQVNDFALGDYNGTLYLWSDRRGNSETSIFHTKRTQQPLVVSVRDALEVFREKGYATDPRTVVKMDVEGSELVILPRLKELITKSKCVWLISLHKKLLPESSVKELVDLFTEKQRVVFF